MPNAIELRGLRRDFGHRPALRGVDLTVPAGASLAVLGPNGSGKTTLLRILATLLRPSSGEATVLGAPLPAGSWRLRGRVGYLGHEPLLYRDLTGRENLRFHAELHGIPAPEERIQEALEAVGMEARAESRAGELSAGMRQRLAICRCVLHRPDLLLLDEPDSHLDSEGRELASRVIGPDEGRTRVVVTHDPERVLPACDLVLVLGPDGAPASAEVAGDLASDEARRAAAGVVA
ncbi:MAG TPA: ABC transporter ATP-binding protein [Solirubrobacterales bacterium]|nr:ABC transporter ATP-binding protein [Solirubrobacterales bacterium]